MLPITTTQGNIGVVELPTVNRGGRLGIARVREDRVLAKQLEGQSA
jgi:hypothetical protein